MFLLIQLTVPASPFRSLSLNSIMFLLIPGMVAKQRLERGFKFHYVSINSIWIPTPIDTLVDTLNSIMFLLISYILFSQLSNEYHFKFHYVSINSYCKILLFQIYQSLNSIMFLLIHKISKTTATGLASFKFHYVSINSWRFG